MRTIERTVYSLCREIDDLREEVAHWKQLYEAERDENIQSVNARLEEGRKGIANALLFAFSVSDDAEGNLIISKENRKQLAENYQ